MSDLPTIEFETEAGAARRIRYERADEAPHRVERHVDRWAGDADGWVPVGAEPLAELVIDGEHRSAVALDLVADGGRR